MAQWVRTAALRTEDYSSRWIYLDSEYSLVLTPKPPTITLPREFASVTVNNWVCRDNVVYVLVTLGAVEEAEILRHKLSMMTNATHNVLYHVTCYCHNSEHCTFTTHAL